MDPVAKTLPLGICLPTVQLCFLPCCVLLAGSLPWACGSLELAAPVTGGCLPAVPTISRVEFHWPSLGYMLVPDPATAATGMQGSDWPGLGHVPTAALGERVGPSKSQVLREFGGRSLAKEKRRAVPRRRKCIYCRQTQTWPSTHRFGGWWFTQIPGCISPL